MTDWADEAAGKAIGRGPWLRKERDAISSALRKARSDALEEAANAVDEFARCGNDDLIELAAVIDALKEKQP